MAVDLSTPQKSKLIELYHAHTVLWDNTLSQYKDQGARSNALASIQTLFYQDCGIRLENPQCRDLDIECSDRAAKGDCTTDPDFMLGSCSKSCGRCQELDPCYSMPCRFGGTCTKTTEGYVCSCTEDYEGTNCENVVDGPCASSPCQHDGTCNQVSSSASYYNCLCLEYYAGANCELTNPCLSSPCLNGGTCSGDAESGDFSCSCTELYTGDTCEKCKDLAEFCTTWLTLGYCEPGSIYHSYMINNCYNTCVCDACSSQPCQNGGTCISQYDTYTCACTSSYVGVNCTETHPCISQPCQNRGTCNPHNESYNCTCADDYIGDDCSIEHVTCKNDTTIHCRYWRSVDYCESASVYYLYMMDNCEYTCKCDPCISQPCQNGGTCNPHNESYNCTCADDYIGDDCSIEHVTCKNDTTIHCRYWRSFGYCESASVYYPYMMNNCEYTCKCDPCLSDYDTYTCSCIASFRGVNCTEQAT